ncbi:MAG TPA: M14 family zinc carboxypeptidase, partial [Nocardioidaceae bacterium]|nr:M14 family zinc carboxypeptidase [Nocardioidaceae bacterium]
MRAHVALSAVVVLGSALLAPVATADESSPPGASASSGSASSGTTSPGDQPVETIVRVRVPTTDALRAMAAKGVDVTHEVAQGPNGTFDATVIVPGGNLDVLTAHGAEVLDTFAAPTQQELQAELKGNAHELTAAQKRRSKPPAESIPGARHGSDRPAPNAPDTTLTVLRADTWTSADGPFLSVEVRSDLGADDSVTVTTDAGQTYTLSPFVDRGVYLYHRMQTPVQTDGPVKSVTATSSDATSVESPTGEWAAGDVSGFPDGFEWGFTDDGYVDATQSDAVIEDLAAQFPDLAEIVTLPAKTHGYHLAPGDETLLGAPDTYPRTPYTMKALRIGSDRSGDKTGVVLYAQEHAREWATSLVALETAQRLLHNYGTDPRTTALVDDLDIFIVPMINPDGVAYSRYDDLFQRDNMNIDDCDYETALNAGTDINRNFSVGSLFDGFVGASDTCTSSVYAGASELSEAESSNEVWLLDNFPNIKFAMNTHSFGGYFMWSPGAYQDDRTTLPRPDLATENYFFAASETILSEIKEYRGTVVWPGRTGPVVDVLYSAAGNSGDEFYYDDELSNDPEIYAWDFEIGVPLWDEATQQWDTSAGGFFWPDFETEGFDQAMEFANGWYGILDVARSYALDDKAPRSSSNVDGKGAYDGPVDVFFDTTEPATVYYTLDGSRPTWDSATVQQDGVRAGAAPVTLTEQRTVLQWFSVDEAGNVEGGYDPDG